MEMMPELDLPQPPKVEELPAAAPPPAGGPLYFPDEPETSGSWLGVLILLVLLFYFFAPAAWKNWVREQGEKLPIEVSVKIKGPPAGTLSVPKVTPSVTPLPPPSPAE